jgi:hypothetical protein
MMLVIVKVEGKIPDYRFLTKRARNEKRIYCWFSGLDTVVPIPTGLGVTRSPSEISFCWCCTTVVVAFFVSRVEMCSIRIQRQIENSKLRLAKLLQPVKSVII